MLSDTTIQKIRKFNRDRDWDQFHSPANLAKSVSIEAGELLECFQWTEGPRDGDTEHVGEELADVLIYATLLADKMGFTLDDIVNDKLVKDARRYPISKFKGSAEKSNLPEK